MTLELVQWTLLVLMTARMVVLEIRMRAFNLRIFQSRYTIRDEVLEDFKTNEFPAIREGLLQMQGHGAQFHVQPMVTRQVPMGQPQHRAVGPILQDQGPPRHGVPEPVSVPNYDLETQAMPVIPVEK